MDEQTNRELTAQESMRAGWVYPPSRVFFGAAIFLGSFLLFLVEPMAAKQLLPALGGSAAVWITCLVFFQTALVVAYLYAHWLARSSRWNPFRAIAAGRHIRSPLDYSIRPSELRAIPVLSIFAALGISIGLPFLMLGATSPLLQVWLARLETGAIPYRLFALSNLASLLALALYPTLIEPYFTLKAQRLVWCCRLCGLRVPLGRPHIRTLGANHFFACS